MKTTRFRLNLPGFTVELQGQRTFVEDLYRKISRDLAPMLAAAAEGRPIKTPMANAATAAQPQNMPTRRNGYTWMYFCSHLFNKVYVVENAAVEATPLGRFIDLDRVRRIYVDAERGTVFDSLTDDNRTLWAEFTEEGRALLKQSVKAHNAGQADASSSGNPTT